MTIRCQRSQDSVLSQVVAIPSRALLILRVGLTRILTSQIFLLTGTSLRRWSLRLVVAGGF